MKTRITLAFLLLFALALPASTQDVLVDYDHTVDFSTYHTYAWTTVAYPVQDQQWNQRLALAVNAELTARGVARVLPEKNFDVFVGYNMKVFSDPNLGQLVKVTVKIVDARNNNVVWSAAANDKYTDDEQQNIQTVRALIKAMFAQYPVD